jgi:N-acetylmuramoyl-L-alanine amidase
MPAIIVEAGFITNPEEYVELFHMETMGAVADAVVKAIFSLERGK